MTKTDMDAPVRLDLNNPVFQENLLTLQKPERHAALDTLNKLRRMTWNQVYLVCSKALPTQFQQRARSVSKTGRQRLNRLRHFAKLL